MQALVALAVIAVAVGGAWRHGRRAPPVTLETGLLVTVERDRYTVSFDGVETLELDRPLPASASRGLLISPMFEYLKEELRVQRGRPEDSSTIRFGQDGASAELLPVLHTLAQAQTRIHHLQLGDDGPRSTIETYSWAMLPPEGARSRSNLGGPAVILRRSGDTITVRIAVAAYPPRDWYTGHFAWLDDSEGRWLAVEQRCELLIGSAEHAGWAPWLSDLLRPFDLPTSGHGSSVQFDPEVPLSVLIETASALHELGFERVELGGGVQDGPCVDPVHSAAEIRRWVERMGEVADTGDKSPSRRLSAD